MSAEHLRWRGLANALEVAAKSAGSSVVLVAPFIKAPILERLLSLASPNLAVTCVTRWHPAEIKAGVSDLEVFDVVSRVGGSLRLRQDLHAKYFRFDGTVYLGSANLTAAALSDAGSANLELLLRLDANPSCEQFEGELVGGTVVVDAELHATMVDLVARLPDRPTAGVIDSPPTALMRWVPHLRQPSDLYSVYKADDRLPLQVLDAGREDLRALAVPSGVLDELEFDAWVAAALLTAPIIQRLDELLVLSRPFGEVRRRLQESLHVDRDEAEVHLQTLIRWLVRFLPTRYEYTRLRYSERLVLRASGPAATFEDASDLLNRLARMRPLRRGGADKLHRPLLLLLALERLNEGEYQRLWSFTEWDAELRKLLAAAGHVTDDARSTVYPWWTLYRTDGLWDIPDAASLPMEKNGRRPLLSALLKLDPLSGLRESDGEVLRRSRATLAAAATGLIEEYLRDLPALAGRFRTLT